MGTGCPSTKAVGANKLVPLTATGAPPATQCGPAETLMVGGAWVTKVPVLVQPDAEVMTTS